MNFSSENQQEIPFFNGKNKYINPDIDSAGIFRLPTTFVLRESAKSRIMIFNRKDDTVMELIPFDNIEDDGTWMKFKYEHNTSNNEMLPIWDCNLLRRFHWSWYEKMYEGLHSNWFINLNKQLNVTERQDKPIWPVKEQVYRAFSNSFGHIKVVIVGQSPYPNDYSNGIAFATDKDTVPVSLQHFKAAIGGNIPNNLQTWVDQGVLLLNSSLTVTGNASVDYFDEWQPFMKLVFSALATKQNLTWILMGRKAQTFKKLIPPNHHVLTCEHPAAAAYDKRDWLHNDVFDQANGFLGQDKLSPIRWNLV